MNQASPDDSGWHRSSRKRESATKRSGPEGPCGEACPDRRLAPAVRHAPRDGIPDRGKSTHWTRVHRDHNVSSYGCTSHRRHNDGSYDRCTKQLDGSTRAQWTAGSVKGVQCIAPRAQVAGNKPCRLRLLLEDFDDQQKVKCSPGMCLGNTLRLAFACELLPASQTPVLDLMTKSAWHMSHGASQPVAAITGRLREFPGRPLCRLCCVAKAQTESLAYAYEAAKDRIAASGHCQAG